jgi:hypothetical protein
VEGCDGFSFVPVKNTGTSQPGIEESLWELSLCKPKAKIEEGFLDCAT